MAKDGLPNDAAKLQPVRLVEVWSALRLLADRYDNVIAWRSSARSSSRACKNSPPALARPESNAHRPQMDQAACSTAR